MKLGIIILIGFGVLITIIKWALIIWGIIWLVRYLKRSGEEKQRFRLELGKLAEEVHLLRQKFENENKDNLSKDPE